MAGWARGSRTQVSTYPCCDWRGGGTGSGIVQRFAMNGGFLQSMNGGCGQLHSRTGTAPTRCSSMSRRSPTCPGRTARTRHTWRGGGGAGGRMCVGLGWGRGGSGSGGDWHLAMDRRVRPPDFGCEHSAGLLIALGRDHHHLHRPLRHVAEPEVLRAERPDGLALEDSGTGTHAVAESVAGRGRARHPERDGEEKDRHDGAESKAVPRTQLSVRPGPNYRLYT